MIRDCCVTISLLRTLVLIVNQMSINHKMTTSCCCYGALDHGVNKPKWFAWQWNLITSMCIQVHNLTDVRSLMQLTVWLQFVRRDCACVCVLRSKGQTSDKVMCQREKWESKETLFGSNLWLVLQLDFWKRLIHFVIKLKFSKNGDLNISKFPLN